MYTIFYKQLLKQITETILYVYSITLLQSTLFAQLVSFGSKKNLFNFIMSRVFCDV